MKRRSRRNLLIAAAAAMGALLVCGAAAQERCKLTAICSATVAAVRDGRTLLLADGRELRLAGIEVADASRAALQALVAGQPLRLERLSPEQDRYGRLLAFAFVGDAQASVQQAMLEQGHARVSARVGDKACADALLSAERAARGCAARALGRSKFRPFVGRKSDPATGRARPFRISGRQGLAGARERGHYICELRAALDAGFHRDHPAAHEPRLRRGRH
jgi:endonuclease YncB( thermonuclease family)